MIDTDRAPRRARAFAVAVLVTAVASALPSWSGLVALWEARPDFAAGVPLGVFRDLALLVLGLALALSAPRASGLCLGTIGPRWRSVLAVCAVPILGTAIVYPNLPERPFADQSWSMWAISPLAQDLIFLGFLYGRLDGAFPGLVHERLRASKALVLTAVLFALWHLPNAATMSAGYFAFQLAYTAAGHLLVGLSRQWTGSILYATLTHSAVNAIAWATS